MTGIYIWQGFRIQKRTIAVRKSDGNFLQLCACIAGICQCAVGFCEIAAMVYGIWVAHIG